MLRTDQHRGMRRRSENGNCVRLPRNHRQTARFTGSDREAFCGVKSFTRSREEVFQYRSVSVAEMLSTRTPPTTRTSLPSVPDARFCARWGGFKWNQRFTGGDPLNTDCDLTRVVGHLDDRLDFSAVRRVSIAVNHAAVSSLAASRRDRRARIPGDVRQRRHPRVPQPTLTSQARGIAQGRGDFSRPCGLGPSRDVAIRAQFGRSACGGRRITSCTSRPRHREPFQARLAPTRRERARATGKRAM